NIESLHKHLCAVMSRPYRDPVIVHYSSEVVWVNVANVERHNAPSVVCIAWAVKCNTLYTRDSINSIFCQLNFMFSDPVHTKFVQVVNRSTKANHISNVWSPTFELVWQIVISCLILVDLLYHVATSHERRHLF